MDDEDQIRPPAVNPCGSCPYRRDVPSGVWSEDEYAKLPPYDNYTPFQPPSVFMCHQQDGRCCAGWVGCHDMGHSLALRIASLSEAMTPGVLDKILDYTTSVPLFSSGAEAAAHGMADIAEPSLDAQRTVRKLEHRLERMHNHTKGER